MPSDASPILIQTLSDIHAEHSATRRPADLGPQVVRTGADIVILAGDTDRASRSVDTAAGMFPDAPALVMVAGNHEPYGSRQSIDACVETMKKQADVLTKAEGRTIAVMENDMLVLDVRGTPVRILGATLWTDYNVFGQPQEHALLVSRALNDYALIRSASGKGNFSTLESMARHERSAKFLADALDEEFPGPTIVVTHHLPSARSLSERYRKDPVSAGFASARDDLLAKGASLWVCGHTHDSHSYRDKSGTLVMCNPSGYPDWMRGFGRENRNFDPRLVVSVRRAANGKWVAKEKRARRRLPQS